ncbi:MAG: 2,3-diaminopropionate biosynthesis protein SbnB [Acidobacteria bacterium]|nr:MAG: 2,3-diaminopropionate biosynthesis protein SbnB [Acidobacteriota bacterium]
MATGINTPKTGPRENNGVRSAPSFFVIPGSTVKHVLDEHKQEVFDAVETAYRLHGSGQSVNPDSYFLRYPDKPSSRIIALPAHLGGQVQKSGIKWISSFPENRNSNLARASAVLILNDPTTGYPLACIEASLISATRTAASAALAAENISPKPFSGTLGVIGTGVIARTTVEWLLFRNWKFNKVNLYDVDRAEAEQFGNWLRDVQAVDAVIHDRLDDAVSDSSLVLFATTASEPYLDDERLFEHSPTVLHLSLRDICPNVILSSQNIVDDVEHSLKARTSLHLTEMKVGNREFIAGTLVDVLEKRVEFDDRPRIFSPFGLGVLDLGVGNFVLQAASSSGAAMELPHFFSNSNRW